jgi:hypothetical protein
MVTWPDLVNFFFFEEAERRKSFPFSAHWQRKRHPYVQSCAVHCMPDGRVPTIFLRYSAANSG